MPRPRSVLTPDGIASLREAYAAMPNYMQVGKLFGVSPAAVKTAVVDGGHWKPAPVRLSLDRREAILAKFRAGEPVRQIARDLKVSQSTVCFYARQAGLSRANGRPPRGPTKARAPVPEGLRRRCPVDGCYDITTNPTCRNGHEVYREATDE